MKLKRFILKKLIEILDKSFEVDYKKINREAVEKWAYESFDDPGWRSYFAYEDLKVLKAMGQGQDNMMYWIHIGRRLALLYLMDEMRRAFENQQTKQEKAKIKKK